MGVIDLSVRSTADVEEYSKNVKSSDSLVLITPEYRLDDGPASVELQVGEGWFDSKDNRFYAIPDSGLQLGPGQSAVLETRQVVGVPLNVFGMVTGKGKFIFKGIHVSSGKIDPGFNSKLRIGLYNAGHDSVSLQSGDSFCSCCFFDMQTNLDHPLRVGDLGPSRIVPSVPRRMRFSAFLSQNWGKLVTISISLAALVISLLGLLLGGN